MQRFLLTFVGALFSVGAVIGCGTSPATIIPPSAPALPTPAPYTLIVFHSPL